jgi:hypothetical protein
MNLSMSRHRTRAAHVDASVCTVRTAESARHSRNEPLRGAAELGAVMTKRPVLVIDLLDERIRLFERTPRSGHVRKATYSAIVGAPAHDRCAWARRLQPLGIRLSNLGQTPAARKRCSAFESRTSICGGFGGHCRRVLDRGDCIWACVHESDRAPSRPRSRRSFAAASRAARSIGREPQAPADRRRRYRRFRDAGARAAGSLRGHAPRDRRRRAHGRRSRGDPRARHRTPVLLLPGADGRDPRSDGNDGAKMYEWFERTGYGVDLSRLRRDFGDVPWHTFEMWARTQTL